MKNLILGLVVGLLVGGLGCYFIIVPKEAEKSYNVGLTKGTTDGTAAGIVEGRKVQKQEDDSLHVKVDEKKVVVHKKRVKAVVKPYVNPYNKNYTVEGNQIGEERVEAAIDKPAIPGN